MFSSIAGLTAVIRCKTHKYHGILVIKKNSQSVLMRWVNLEPVIQSEVSQKEKNKYCILMHIYGI